MLGGGLRLTGRHQRLHQQHGRSCITVSFKVIRTEFHCSVRTVVVDQRAGVVLQGVWVGFVGAIQPLDRFVGQTEAEQRRRSNLRDLVVCQFTVTLRFIGPLLDQRDRRFVVSLMISSPDTQIDSRYHAVTG